MMSHAGAGPQLVWFTTESLNWQEESQALPRCHVPDLCLVKGKSVEVETQAPGRGLDPQECRPEDSRREEGGGE